MRKTAVLGALLLFGAAGCADLDVVNPNEPDAARALQTPGDVESLVSGSFRQWWRSSHRYTGASPILSNQAWQHSQWPANFGVVHYSGIPRVPITNDPAHTFYSNIAFTWFQNYRALAAVADGLRSIETKEGVAEGLGPERTTRARAFGKFVQGLAHGSIALFYDQGFIIDETTEITDEAGQPLPQPMVSYSEMLDAALGYFDEAIALSENASFTIPNSWMSVDVPAAELARVAHSMKARYRAAVARTPAERESVDWAAVIADIEAGIEESWEMDLPWFGSPWTSWVVSLYSLSAWQQLSYQVLGMADQSGNYQTWLSIEPSNRMPDLPDGSPFLIITPDERFPQGSTLEEQAENPGTLYEIPGYSLSNNWKRPDRGTFRWSYYRSRALDFNLFGEDMVPEITIEEMDLLKAEALLRTGNELAAAEIINRTRTDAGLSPAVPGALNDGNTSCVPKLPDGSCGDLLEMLKWEKRLHTQFLGLHAAPWYFEGRGWGDLYAGTQLHFPIPCGELQVLQEPCYTTGGLGGDGSSPGSVYNWPFEG